MAIRNKKSSMSSAIAAANAARAGSGSNRTTTILSGALGVVLVAMAIASVSISNKTSKDQADLQVLSDLRALSYRTMESSRLAISGDQKAFVELENSVSEMERITTRFADPNGELYAELPTQLQDFTNQWNAVKSAANKISKDEASIVLTNDVAKRLNETIPELQREYDNVIDILVDKNSSALLTSQARRQSWLAERIARNVDLIRFGGSSSQAAADQFNNDIKLFARYMNGFKDGDRVLQVPKIDDPDARTSLEQVIKMFKFVSDSAEQIYKAAPNVAAANEANAQLMKDIPVLLEKLGQLNDSVAKLKDNRIVSANLLYLLGALALGLIASIGAILYKANTERLRLQEQENNSNQNAISVLMEEIAQVSAGDLTTNATVSDEITGAIAESINTTISSLRDIVGGINETIDNVTAAASESEKIAIELADAADKQNREISQASSKINEMAVSIERVSESASESAAVAKKSVQYAENGAEMVHKTIEGMQNIREQIQETSKRIKRLGESSQEIGDIVSLINEIAEQTNVLALNAAIQAAMAGDAGRGFAVVADEVQRLAERSGAATKQIAALVKTIQTDTSEAVASMEQTTTEVVRGARLAQDAGGALDNIETVSSEMEKLIGDISSAAKHQAQTAATVTRTMGVIQDITQNTSKMAQQSAQSIAQVGKMSYELVESVAGFKLPHQSVRSVKSRR